MAEIGELYPPGPEQVPSDLTHPTPQYRQQVLVVLACLLLFLVLYLGLVVGSGWLCYWCFSQASKDAPDSSQPAPSRSRRAPGAPGQYGQAPRPRRAGVETPEVAPSIPPSIPQSSAQPPRGREPYGPYQFGPSGRLMGRDTPQTDPGRQVFGSAQFNSRAPLGRESRQAAPTMPGRQDLNPSLFGVNPRQPQAGETPQISPHLPVAQPPPTYAYGRQPSRSKGDSSSFWLVILGICSALLCLFLVKGLFKRQPVDRSLQVPISETEQPILFAFIRQVCRDTGAPRPRHVFLTAEVNAAVFYHSSFLSLFLPTRKNLLIGLGLVNRLNLSEFKAVLAHEFGHFSQKSMKLGSYVYMANRIIADIVFGRDWLDDLVAAIRGFDIRIAVFAWGFTGILWGVRKALQGVFKAINFANSSLARRMEFNADLVAVSVSGSDALIHGLARLDFANESLMFAWRDLTAAADHGLYSRDLFHHQTKAAEYIRELRKDPRLGEPPPLPADGRPVQVFQPGDEGVPLMWATHPSNYDREQNAKRHYLRCPLDERPAWALFEDGAVAREKVTRRFYEVARKVKNPALQAPEAVQAFIDNEHAETTYHPRYHGMYDDRYIQPGQVGDRGELGQLDAAALTESQARLYDEGLKTRMEACQKRRGEYQLLAGLVSGSLELKGKDFPFRDSKYVAADAPRLLQQVEKELDQDYEWLANVDRQVYRIHGEMARQLGDNVRAELEERYRFHVALQAILGELTGHSREVQATLAHFSGRRELSQEEFHHLRDVFDRAHQALGEKVAAAGALHLPALKNVSAGEPLGPFLLGRPLVRGPSRSSVDGKWVNAFMEQVGEVIDKAGRIHFKSLGGILALQERIAEQWTALQAKPADQTQAASLAATAS